MTTRLPFSGSEPGIFAINLSVFRPSESVGECALVHYFGVTVHTDGSFIEFWRTRQDSNL